MLIFIAEIDEKSSFNGGFSFDSVMTRDSGLFVLGHPACPYLTHIAHSS